MNERLKEQYSSKNIIEKKVGFEGKTEFRVWPQNRVSAFSRPNPQGLSWRVLAASCLCVSSGLCYHALGVSVF